jgi:hypothetical protein
MAVSRLICNSSKYFLLGHHPFRFLFKHTWTEELHVSDPTGKGSVSKKTNYFSLSSSSSIFKDIESFIVHVYCLDKLLSNFSIVIYT